MSLSSPQKNLIRYFDDVIGKKSLSLSNLCAAMLDAAGTSRTPGNNYRCDQKYKYNCDMDELMDGWI